MFVICEFTVTQGIGQVGELMAVRKRNPNSVSSAGASSGDALSAYFRMVGDLPPLAVEAQTALGGAIDDATGKLRGLLVGFDFVVGDILRLIDLCWSFEASPADIFMPSSLPEANAKSSASTLAALRSWRGELEALLKHPGDDRRGELPLRYPVNASFLGKYHSAVERAVSALRQESGTSSEEGDALFVSSLAEVSRRSQEDPEGFYRWYSAIEEAHENLLGLRMKMVESNLRLVISIARRYRSRGLPFDDLIQEGNIGLLHALERFDFKLGHKFSTYASWWIHHCISRAAAEQVRIIRLPVHMIKTITAMNRAEQRFIHLNGREPEMTELAALLELPVARVNAIRKMSCQTISLQSALAESDDSATLEDIVADDETNNPMAKYAHKVLFQKLYEVLQTLPERERKIIFMRFGLYGQPRLPLNEISDRVGLTRERVRQLEKKVLATLRSPSKIKYIEGGL